MSAIKIWIISGWSHLLVAGLIGWLVLKRPQWATDLINKAIDKIRFW